MMIELFRLCTSKLSLIVWNKKEENSEYLIHSKDLKIRPNYWKFGIQNNFIILNGSNILLHNSIYVVIELHF